MCEVTKTNFNELFNQIQEDFKKSAFLSIDCEFSALRNDADFVASLFDTPCERYRIMKENLKNAIPLEIGITAFIFDRDCGMYIAKPYKFYVFPVHFGLIDKVFHCQASSFHFLGEHQFDFNKVIYCGIPYLTNAQEIEIKQYIEDDRLFNYCKFALDSLRSEEILKYLSEITEWFHNKKTANEITLFDNDTKDPTFLYILHIHIRNRFPTLIWTFEENEQFKIRRVCAEKYKKLSETEKLDKILLNNLLGFTKIYRLLASLKKPIVGHNCFLDLLLLVSTFDNALPNSYTAFKKLVNEHFPKIFDTKSISFDLFHSLNRDLKPNISSLKNLFYFFRNESGRHLAPHSPRIEIAEEFKTSGDDKFHDAGWDAYCTGYCFIRMAHYFVANGGESRQKKVYMSTHLLNAVEKYMNQVNVIRATTPYLNFSGPDPQSNRPPCLIIQSRNNMPVDIYKVTELLREYGSVDIRPYSSRGTRAIAAVANFGSFRRILGKFHNHKEYQIVTYNALKHSPVARAALWGGVITSGGIVAWLIHSQISNT